MADSVSTSPVPVPPEDSGSSSPSDSPRLIVVPFQWQQGDPRRLSYILDKLVERTLWMNVPTTEEERRNTYAHHLTNPLHGTFEVWQGGEIVGILFLYSVVPGVEANLHFAFFDGNLLGKRTLLKQFVAKCFRDFGFRRLVIEFPEPYEKLIQFARSKLGFRYEGETVVANHPVFTQISHGLADLKMPRPEIWVARQGSRREQAHWLHNRWVDVIRLRLLASECEGRM